MKISTSTETNTDFDKPLIEEGLYSAKLKEVKDISDGQYGKRVVWIYTIIGKEVDLPFICYLPEVANPNTKFGKTLIAHGVDLGSEVDVKPLYGSEVKVLVENYDIEDGKKASSISKVKPLAETEKVE